MEYVTVQGEAVPALGLGTSLATSYLDLLLVHWPAQIDLLPATLEAMLRLREQGKVRLIGLSNASSREHLQANLAVFDFRLTDEETDRIAERDRGERLIDPPWMTDWSGNAPHGPLATLRGPSCGRTPPLTTTRGARVRH